MKLARIFLNIFSKGKKLLSNHNCLCLIAVRQKKIPPFVFFFDVFFSLFAAEGALPGENHELTKRNSSCLDGGTGQQKCKNAVTKTTSKNASTRAKNRDETAFFALACRRFSLFAMSKHSFCVVKAALSRGNSYAFTR